VNSQKRPRLPLIRALMISRWLALAAIVVASLVWAAPAHEADGNELVHISSQVVYNVRPDLGPVRVAWDVTLQNDDPATSNGSDGGTVFFYENLTVPLLKGASAISAVSSSGTPLAVTLGEPERSPAVGAVVSFEAPVFYGESYSFRLEYELSDVREESLLVSSTYVYLPVIVGGDESAVTVNTPSGGGWSVSVEPGECAQDGATFTCSGDDASFLAALVEVSRPDALTTIAFKAPMQGQTIDVQLSYFEGEEATALHLRDLVIAGLPQIESLFGFAYPATPAIEIAQGGRQVVLGYEGLTSCDPAIGCRVVVSPVADDVTVLHELVHLWSGVHGKRWLSEGFAQLIAEEAAAALPPGLVQSYPPEREPATVELPLDEWGDVSSLIGAAESEIADENAGYGRSLQFLYLLRTELGSEVLRQVNEALAAEDAPADSRRFLDLVEEKSGKRVDALFGQWVFPPSLGPTLAKRREARERVDSLAQLAADEGLPEELPQAIRADVAAWKFDKALSMLAEAETKLGQFKEIKAELAQLTADAEAAGLALPASIADALGRWEFGGARLLIAEAKSALDRYKVARDRVEAPRDIWQRFGLIGSNPDRDLARASDAFVAGEFQTSLDRANEAATTVGDASESALLRLFIIGLALGIFASGVGIAVWISQRQEREFAES
jgi:hypothetical protein